MVGILIIVVAVAPRTDEITEQLNVFGRNLNTVSPKYNFRVTFVADNDRRSKVKTGSVKGDSPLQISMRERAR